MDKLGTGRVPLFGMNNLPFLDPIMVECKDDRQQNGSQIVANTKMMSISCGESHNLLIDSENKLWIFGNNDTFQLGTNMTNKFDF